MSSGRPAEVMPCRDQVHLSGVAYDQRRQTWVSLEPPKYNPRTTVRGDLPVTGAIACRRYLSFYLAMDLWHPVGSWRASDKPSRVKRQRPVGADSEVAARAGRSTRDVEGAVGSGQTGGGAMPDQRASRLARRIHGELGARNQATAPRRTAPRRHGTKSHGKPLTCQQHRKPFSPKRSKNARRACPSPRGVGAVHRNPYGITRFLLARAGLHGRRVNRKESGLGALRSEGRH